MVLPLTSLLNKLGDQKFNGSLTECLNTMSDSLGPKTVVNQILKRIENKSLKSPKNISSALE